MDKLITYDSLRRFAYSNDKLCSLPIKAIALRFAGLGDTRMFGEDNSEDVELAKRGIIFIAPYLNPWAWMNRDACAICDEIVSVVMEKYGLSRDIPIISTGGSMGGLSALVYTRYAAITPSVCVANCPVCDLPYHYTEREDLPRTLYSAFYSYQGSLDEALKSASPLDLVPEMPDIEYHIFHCDADKAVNKEKHSDRFVSAMKGKNLTYRVVPGRGHCDLDDSARAEYNEYIYSAAK